MDCLKNSYIYHVLVIVCNEYNIIFHSGRKKGFFVCVSGFAFELVVVSGKRRYCQDESIYTAKHCA